jgi:hypothetical protein
MACYYYKKIHETSNPIFKDVDITIILIMENSDRFKPDPFLLNLSKETIIQYNKGFKKCYKHSSIKKSNTDLIHAYYTAFEYTKNYNNVLILEEDAEILYYNKKHYTVVNNFIKNNNFKIFSFASNGTFEKINNDFYKVYDSHSTHAQIYSKDHRTFMMNRILKNKFMGEIDTTYIRDRDVIVYKHPLIVQIYPETENFNNWSGNKFINKLGCVITGVNKYKQGWENIYIICKIRGVLNAEYILVMTLITLIVIYKMVKFYKN